MNTQKQIRKAFQIINSAYKISKKHNEQSADVRLEFCLFVDSLERDNVISRKLANRTTMG